MPPTRRKYGIAICRIERSWPHPLAAAIGDTAVCLSCSAILPPLPLALAVVEVEGAGVAYVSGICATCARTDDRSLIATAFIEASAVFPRLRPLHPETGSA
jgi:hypothetical protein